jgi:hypothetical protein
MANASNDSYRVATEKNRLFSIRRISHGTVTPKQMPQDDFADQKKTVHRRSTCGGKENQHNG